MSTTSIKVKPNETPAITFLQQQPLEGNIPEISLEGDSEPVREIVIPAPERDYVNVYRVDYDPKTMQLVPTTEDHSSEQKYVLVMVGLVMSKLDPESEKLLREMAPGDLLILNYDPEHEILKELRTRWNPPEDYLLNESFQALFNVGICLRDTTEDGRIVVAIQDT